MDRSQRYKDRLEERLRGAATRRVQNVGFTLPPPPPRPSQLSQLPQPSQPSQPSSQPPTSQPPAISTPVPRGKRTRQPSPDKALNTPEAAEVRRRQQERRGRSGSVASRRSGSVGSRRSASLGGDEETTQKRRRTADPPPQTQTIVEEESQTPNLGTTQEDEVSTPLDVETPVRGKGKRLVVTREEEEGATEALDGVSVVEETQLDEEIQVEETPRPPAPPKPAAKGKRPAATRITDAEEREARETEAASLRAADEEEQAEEATPAARPRKQKSKPAANEKQPKPSQKPAAPKPKPQKARRPTPPPSTVSSSSEDETPANSPPPARTNGIPITLHRLTTSKSTRLNPYDIILQLLQELLSTLPPSITPFRSELETRFVALSDLYESRLAAEAQLRRARARKAELRAALLDVQRRRMVVAAEVDEIRERSAKAREEGERQRRILDGYEEVSGLVEKGRAEGGDEEEELHGLEGLAVQVADLVSSVVGSGGGLLGRVKELNGFLERAEEVLRSVNGG